MDASYGTGLSRAALEAAFAGTPMFAGKEWRLSPSAWRIDAAGLDELRAIGRASLAFMRGVELLYQRSAAGASILRNREVRVPWVAELYERGKPSWLVAHARHARVRGGIPAVLRPDLLRCDDGWALTELDSVPGGVGLTAFLGRLYGAAGASVPGAGDGMVVDFLSALAHAAPRGSGDGAGPCVLVAVSEEASDYRPELEWLAAQARERGQRVWCVDALALEVSDAGVEAETGSGRVRADVVYRFFELFDHAALPFMPALAAAVEAGRVVVTPPMKPHLEEKLSLALFRHPDLADYWREVLDRQSLALLRTLIPESWILRTEPLPPGAHWDGPQACGRPLASWRQLGAASQKERELVLKISGFDPTCWGARGVHYGADMPGDAWRAAVDAALEVSRERVFIVQRYRKPMVLEHPVFDAQGAVAPMPSRLRLCPYFMVQGADARLAGALATFCPADKKIIHGMRDAALVPLASG